MTVSIKSPTSTTGSIQLNGSDVLTIESDNSVDIDSGTLHVDATNNRVGVGTSSPSAKLEVNAGDVFQQMIIRRGTSGVSAPIMSFVQGDGTAVAHVGGAGANGGLQLRTGSGLGTERMRIAASNGYVGFAVTSPTYMIHLNGGSPTTSNSGIAAAWNVHSDYRLKENVSSINDATNIVKNLNPVNFSWIEDNSDIPTTQGFIAHELQENAPFAVLGNKDAVNENGDNIYQAADYSRLVPLLTAALQEAITKIEDLETRIEALEAN